MRFLFFILMVFALSACGSNDPHTNNTNETTSEASSTQHRIKEIMAVHDEVMPKMSNISRLRRDLTGYLEQHPDLDPAKIEELNTIISHLNTADEGMMTWMAEWTNQQNTLKKYQESNDQAAINIFMEEQMKSITQVKNDMLNSINAGEEVINTLVKE